jgi:hypothetical protein
LCLFFHTASASLFDACKKHGIIPAAALSAAFLKTVASLKELKEKKHEEFTYTWCDLKEFLLLFVFQLSQLLVELLRAVVELLVFFFPAVLLTVGAC